MNKLIIADSFNDANMLYLTKVLVPDPFIFLSLKNKNYVLVNTLEFSRIKQEAKSSIIVLSEEKYIKKAKSKFKKINLATIACLFLKEKGIKKINVPYNFPLIYAEELKKNNIKTKILSPFLNRSIKSSEEIKEIEKVQKIVDLALTKISRIIKSSKEKNNFLFYNGRKITSEYLKEIAEELFIHYGLESPEGIIISSGKDTSYPHKEGAGPIHAGVPIVMDIYPRSIKSRYFSDFTRTLCKGRPKAQKMQEIYNIILEAQRAAINLIKEGISCKTLHDAVLSVFKKYKVEKFFIHSTGHGVGIELHESPSIPSKTKLKAGMLITIEPGLYIPNLGGVRIEDIFLVKKNGYKALSKIEKRFIV